MASNSITAWQVEGKKVEVVTDFLFSYSTINADGDWSHEIRRCLLLGRKVKTNLDSVLKNRDITLPTKVYIVKAMVLPVVTYGWKSWTVKKAVHQHLWIVLLEKTPESPLDSKEIKPVNLKWDQPWIFTGRTDAEAEAPVFWSSDVMRWLIGKVPDAGKDWGQKKKRTLEDEMAGWHHWCNEHELGQTPRDGEGQGSLACCSHWVAKSRTQLGDWTTMYKEDKMS